MSVVSILAAGRERERCSSPSSAMVLEVRVKVSCPLELAKEGAVAMSRVRFDRKQKGMIRRHRQTQTKSHKPVPEVCFARERQRSNEANRAGLRIYWPPSSHLYQG